MSIKESFSNMDFSAGPSSSLWGDWIPNLSSPLAAICISTFIRTGSGSYGREWYAGPNLAWHTCQLVMATWRGNVAKLIITIMRIEDCRVPTCWKWFCGKFVNMLQCYTWTCAAKMEISNPRTWLGCWNLGGFEKCTGGWRFDQLCKSTRRIAFNVGGTCRGICFGGFDNTFQAIKHVDDWKLESMCFMDMTVISKRVCRARTNPNIHTASRGVAAHTTSLFWIVTHTNI